MHQVRHRDDASLIVHPLFYFDVLVGWAELLLVATHAHYLKCPSQLFLIRKHERPSCLDKIRQHDHNLRPARMRMLRHACRHFSIANILILTHCLKSFRRYSSIFFTSILSYACLFARQVSSGLNVVWRMFVPRVSGGIPDSAS